MWECLHNNQKSLINTHVNSFDRQKLSQTMKRLICNEENGEILGATETKISCKLISLIAIYVSLFFLIFYI